jgi:hypothetical protein
MKTSKLIWIPRVLLIVLIGFISIFSFDVFEGSAPLIDKLLALLIHLIPSFLMLIVLIISWIIPQIGGILCIILGGVFGVWFRAWNVFTSQGVANIFPLILVLLLVIVGILFIAFGRQRKKLTENP